MHNNLSIKEATKSVWGASPAGSSYAKEYAKGTKEFFQTALNKRSTEECPWLNEIVNFKQFKNKEVLEIGCGVGFDAYQFCKYGALYTGIDITPENPLLTKKHLAFYDYHPQAYEMDTEQLSLNNGTYDFVYSFGVLHHTPNFEKAIKNIYHALKDDGEAQIIVYHKHSIFYVISLALCDWLFTKKVFTMTLQERLSLIEYTTSSAKPLVRVYSKKELHRLLKKAGFRIIQTDIRKLIHEGLPYIRFISKSFKFIPKSWLNFLGKRFGWYISVRMVKEQQ